MRKDPFELLGEYMNMRNRVVDSHTNSSSRIGQYPITTSTSNLKAYTHPLDPSISTSNNQKNFIEFRNKKQIITHQPQQKEIHFRQISPFRERDDKSKQRIFGDESFSPASALTGKKIFPRAYSCNILSDMNTKEDFQDEIKRKTENRKMRLIEHYAQNSDHWNPDTILTYKEIVSQIPERNFKPKIQSKPYEDRSLTEMKNTMKEKAERFRSKSPNSVLFGISEGNRNVFQRSTSKKRIADQIQQKEEPNLSKGFSKYTSSLNRGLDDGNDTKRIQLTPTRKMLLEEFRGQVELQ